MTTLKEAREKGKLEEFIVQREAEGTFTKGDADQLRRIVSAMAGKSKPVPETSTKDESDD